MKARSSQRRNKGKRLHYGHALRIMRAIRGDSVVLRVVDVVAEKARNVEIILTEQDLTECLKALGAHQSRRIK